MIVKQKEKSYLTAHMKFWSKFVLEGLGMAAGLALIFLLFQIFRTDGNSASDLVAQYPFYFFIMGAIMIMLTVNGCFQTLFSVLMSMNVTRKAVTTGMLFSEAAMILIIYLVALIVWTLVPSGISEVGIMILPLLLGMMFAAGSVATTIGVASLKWGNIGTILSVGFYGILGAGLGASFSMIGRKNDRLLDLLAGLELYWMLGAGVVLYAITCIFVFAAIRKMEVRR